MRKLPVVHIYSCAVGQITTIIRASRARKRGASRSSRTLSAGCDGRGVLQCVIHMDGQHGADGEIVWSWRPLAGVKFAVTDDPQATVTTKPGLTGESTYKP